MKRKWDIEDIREVLRECDEIFEEYNSLASEIPIEINNRLKTTLGRFCFRGERDNYVEPVKFDFHKDIVSGVLEDEYIEKVIKHEYCHYIAQEVTGKQVGHGKVFQEFCNRIGIPSSPYIERVTEREYLNKYKYKLTCSSCGKKVAYRKRVKIDYFNRVVTSCCKAKVHIEEL